LGTTDIFLGDILSTAGLIDTLAHEWAHQWGADEAHAQATGDAVRDAYLADKGKKCGGL